MSSVSLDLAAKRIAVAKELLPGAKRIAVLLTTTTSATQRAADESRAAARQMGVEMQITTITMPGEIDTALEAARQWRADVVVVYSSPIFNSERARLAATASRLKLPLIGESREFAEAGFVLGYGPSIGDATRRAGAYADKILKGANPAETPIERPNKYELTVNLRAAKALGIAVPQSLLARADGVIQ